MHSRPTSSGPRAPLAPRPPSSASSTSRGGGNDVRHQRTPPANFVGGNVTPTTTTSPRTSATASQPPSRRRQSAPLPSSGSATSRQPTNAGADEDPYFLKSVGSALSHKTSTLIIDRRNVTPSLNLTRQNLYSVDGMTVPVPSPRPTSAHSIRQPHANQRPTSSISSRVATPRHDVESPLPQRPPSASTGGASARRNDFVLRQQHHAREAHINPDSVENRIDSASPYLFGTYAGPKPAAEDEQGNGTDGINEREIRQAMPTRPPRPTSAREPFRDEIEGAFAAAKTTSTAQVFCPQPPVAPNDAPVISSLRTLHDVVSYFSREAATGHGADSNPPTATPCSSSVGTSSVKFIHMARVPQLPGEPYAPYNYEVLGPHPSKDQAEREDVIIVSNASVVMRSVSSGHSTEVSSLAAFARDAYLFAVLRKLPFFARYLKFKAFTLWLKGVKRRKFMAKRKALSEQLFQAKRSFSAPLRELRKHSYDMLASSLIRVPASRDGIQLSEFIALIIKHKSAVSETFRSTVEGIDKLLALQCHRVAALADVPDFASSDALNQYFELTEDEAAREEGVIVSKRAISIVQAKQNSSLRLQQLRASLDQYVALPRYIRLVDAMCAEFLYQNCVYSVRALRRELESTGDAKLVTFIVAINIVEDGLEFLPSRDDVNGAMAEIVEELVATASYVPRLVNSQNYVEYFSPASASSVVAAQASAMVTGGRPRLAPLADALRRDHRVTSDLRKAQGALNRDFQQSADATAPFKANYRWVTFVNQEWPSTSGDWDGRFQLEATHKDIAESIDGAVTAAEIAALLSKADQGIASVKDLHTIRRGCLLVTPLAIMEFLIAKLKEVQEGAQLRLARIARGRLDRLSFSLTSKMRGLQDRPSTLPRFAEFAQNLNNVLAFVRNIEPVLLNIEELFALGEVSGFTLEDTSKRDAVLGESVAGGRVGGAAMVYNAASSVASTPPLGSITPSSVDVGGLHGQVGLAQSVGGPSSSSDLAATAAGANTTLQQHYSSSPSYAGGTSVYDRFIAAVEAAKAFRAANLEDQLDTLHDELDEVEDQVQSLIELLGVDDLDIYTTEFGERTEYLAEIEDKLRALEERVSLLSSWEVLLEGSPSEVTLMDSARRGLRDRKELWGTIERWETLRQTTFAMPLCTANIEDFANQVDEMFTRTYTKLHPKYANNASETLLDQLKETKQIMPILLQLGNRDLKPEHWAVILAPSGRPYDASISLDSAKQLRLFDLQYHEVIAEQSEIATGEAKLTTTLETIEAVWAEVEFRCKTLRQYTDKFILDDVSEIVQLAEEHQLLIQGCLASRFLSGVRAEVEAWDRSLSILCNTIDAWLTVQGSWIYLEYIFSFEDIKQQLPGATAAFQQVDRDFTALIARTRETRLCMPIVLNAPVLQLLEDASKALDEVQKKLEEYLETKRSAFPRFYFLSNDELISILSDVRNPKAVQPHLRKCFENIKSLTFATDELVSGMVSSEGETVAFQNHVQAKGNVESWLRGVELAMMASLKHHMKRSIILKNTLTGPKRRLDWIMSVQNGPKDKSANALPSQCIQAVDMGDWTGDTERAIASSSLPQFLSSYLAEIDSCVQAVRGELSPLQRALFGTLLVLNVHNRDVLESLVRDGAVVDVKDFKWTVQLRYYCEPSGLVSVEQVNSKCAYSYEYLGSVRRLVITPLTDRAFLTCTQAVHLNLGAAPQGPAGTGKTESVKDLGKALARQVVVFNCSDGINVAIMSRMFAGLAQAGAWACFDEFNRIELEVLSVIAQQMLEITSAVARKKDRMLFDGRDIALHPNFGVFITMNPGYAGRTELPDNLKALFRPVCMMVPDYRLIAEIMFFSEGFSQARSLSTKMVQLYKLSSEQLSKQDHYDFGMRAVKSVLVLAGALKRAHQDEDENMLLIRAMRDTNIPKFLREDAALFRAIINDLFPGMIISEHRNVTLDGQIRVTAEGRGLQATDGLLEKALQLYDTLKVRHGLMLVGATLTGKTETMNVLEGALTELGNARRNAQMDAATTSAPAELQSHLYNNVTQHRLNPKAMSGDELYGAVNPTTREWSDGVLSSISRELVHRNASGEDTLGRHWVVFDGPVDAIWIENMNTVLDDNKMLCLVNGERLKIPDTVTFCFEVEDLIVASPATVSRCGMVYFEPTGGDAWRPLLASLNASMSKSLPDGLWQGDVIAAIGDKLIVSFEESARPLMQQDAYIHTVMPQMVRNMLRLLHGLVHDMATADDEPVETPMPHHQPLEDDDDDEDAPMMEPVRIEVVSEVDRDLPPLPSNPNGLFRQLATFAFIWAFGGANDSSGRDVFDAALGGIVRAFCPSLPSEGSLFSLSVHRRSGTWVPWEYRVPVFVFDPYVNTSDMIVPTPQNTATRTILLTLLRQQQHVLLTGVSGTGKSVTLRSMMFDDLDTEEPSSPWDTFSVVFSARTSADNLTSSLNNSLRKHPSKVKNTLHIGPAANKHVVVVVDDVNMPQPEQYGASPPLELLRQLITQGGMYDTKKCMFKFVTGVTFALSCAPPGGGRNEMSKRLTSQFFTLCQPELGEPTLRSIYSSLLQGFLHRFTENVQALRGQLVSFLLETHASVKGLFLTTPDKPHYVFSTRDLGKVMQGIAQMDPPNVITKKELVDVAVHELSRVLHDRLTCPEDCNAWFQLLGRLVEKIFDLPPDEEWPDMIFGDFGSSSTLQQQRGGGSSCYNRMEWTEELTEVLEEKMSSYGLHYNRELDLALFKDAVLHVVRLARILRQPRGHALLVGVSGSGRQSLANLASFIAESTRYLLQATRNYDTNDFRRDIQKGLLDCGCDNRSGTLIISENQLVKESFLEDINYLLNTGELPIVWEQEEIDRMVESVRPALVAAKKPETINLIKAEFVRRCRNNLHVVLTVSPVGSKFRHRLRMFPSLVNIMTIDWYGRWPHDALTTVSSKLIRSIPGLGHQDALVEKLGELSVAMHEIAEEAAREYSTIYRRPIYLTPTSYLAQIELFVDLYQEETDRHEGKVSRFKMGIEKLLETKADVDSLKSELSRMQPLLVKQAKETEEFAASVATEQAAATVVAEKVSREEATCGNFMAECRGIKDECQTELDKAMPAYHSALDALNALNTKDINEARSYTAPPKKVALIMDGVLTVLDEGLGWDNARRVMGRPDFIQTLKNFSADNVPEKVLKKLKRFTAMEEFSPGQVQNVSRACVSFCMWCIAIDNYCDILKVVKPKQLRLKQAEERLGVASAELKLKQAELAKVEGKIADLKAHYTTSQKRLTALEHERNRTEVHLSRAEKILAGLASEEVRWSEQVSELEGKRRHFVGTVALAAAMIAYGGPFNGEYRSQMGTKWIQLCLKAGLSLEYSDSVVRLRDLVEPVVVRGWASHGLPADDVTVSNAIMATKAKKWCLCVDPQGQANRWIRTMYRNYGLMILKPSDDDLLRHLETAVRTGTPVLLEGVGETLDPSLTPILTHATFRQGGATLMTIRDQAVEYHPDFFFIMTTRHSNPHFLPEVQVQVTLLNFSLTEVGLEDQLLGEVVRHEESALEERADGLVMEIASNESALAEVQDRILQLISGATGNLLENEVLINTLEQSKVTSEVIKSSLAGADEAQKEIKAVREQYRPVAAHGALLYTVVSSLGDLNHTYQTSLTSFVSLLTSTMTTTASAAAATLDGRRQRVAPTTTAAAAATAPPLVAVRCKELIEALTYNTYCTTSRGMFEKDKSTFSFLIATRLAVVRGVIPTAHWQFFVRGSRGQAPLSSVTDPPTDWITETMWEDIEYLDAFDGYPKGIPAAIAANPSAWKELFDDPAGTAVPPVEYAALSTFQRLMLMRFFRYEAAYRLATQFTEEQLGATFVRSPEFNLASCYERSSATSPIILLLSEGTDPTALFEEFAAKSGFSNKRHMLSLGQGQGPKAEKLITEATRTGHWVYLQNCHVYAAWMPALEEIVESLPEMRANRDFRLWLTTLPVDCVPIAVLQLSVKVTKEPPMGLKASLIDTMTTVAQSHLWSAVSSGRRRDNWHRVLFSMSLFHASILQRRRFGPLGWNSPYEWNSGDLLASLKALREFVEYDGNGGDSSEGSLPWTSLQYLVGSINYGGRVTDQWDSRCLESRIQGFLCPEILVPGHAFFPTSSTIKAPATNFTTVADALKYIEDTMPAHDHPGLFGLHENAEIAYQSQMSQYLFDSVVRVQPRASSTAAADPRQPHPEGLDTIVDLLLRLPPIIDRSAAHPTTFESDPATDTMTPLSTVAHQEIDRFNRAIAAIQATLRDLQLCLRGTLAISDALEVALDSILLGKIPVAWERILYESTRALPSWFGDFVQRVEFFRDWSEGGAPPSFWLGGFIFPQGFLTAVLQTFSRRHAVALDGVAWQAVISKDFDRFDNALEWLPDGVYVYGLSLEGARWDSDRGCLAEQHPREVTSKVPILALLPVVAPSPDQRQPLLQEAAIEKRYLCPTYKSSTRRGTLSTTGISTNYIVSLDLPCGGDSTPSQWIARGAALIASPTD